MIIDQNFLKDFQEMLSKNNIGAQSDKEDNTRIIFFNKNNNEENFSIKKDKKTPFILVILFIASKNKSYSNFKGFENNYKTCEKFYLENNDIYKNLENNSINNTERSFIIFFINKINNILKEKNVFKLNQLDYASSDFNLKIYPFVNLTKAGDKKYKVDFKNILEFLKKIKVHHGSLEKIEEIYNKTFDLEEDKFKQLIIKNISNDTNKFKIFINKLSSLAENDFSFFLQKIDDIFTFTEKFDPNLDKKTDKKQSEKPIDIKKEKVLDSNISGSPDAIFNFLENLKINYKEKRDKQHFSGKVIAKVIGEGLGEEFLNLRGFKFDTDPVDNRVYMDASCRGAKFLWCGAAAAYFLKDTVPISMRKSFRSTSALNFSYGRDKRICTYNSTKDKYPEEGQIKEGDIICISSKRSGQVSGGGGSRYGDHICYVKDVKISNNLIDSITTYEGNTYVGGRNTFGSKKRNPNLVKFAYRFDGNDDHLNKYKLIDKIFPGLRTNDYTVLYSTLLNDSFIKRKKFNSNKILNFLNNKKNVRLFKRKYLTKKEIKNTLKKINAICKIAKEKNNRSSV